MNKKHLLTLLYLVAFSPLLAAETKPQPAAETERDEYAESTVIADPLEPVNRATFWFNDKVYRFLFEPISKAYTTILPKLVRRGIDNAYENAKYPVRLVGSLMQGKLDLAARQSGKFLINSTVGVGGILKPSQKVNWTKDLPAEDMGQALAKWGVGHGFYFVLPVMGPSSGRELIGMGVDYAANPVNWLWVIGGGAEDWAWIPPAGNSIASMPEGLSRYKDSTKDAIDPYTSVRSTFVQNRRSATER